MFPYLMSGHFELENILSFEYEHNRNGKHSDSFKDNKIKKIYLKETYYVHSLLLQSYNRSFLLCFMIEFTRSIFLLHKIAFVFQFKFLSCHNAAIAILSRMPLRRNEFSLFDAVCFGNQNRKLFFHRMFLIQFRV